MVAEYTGREYHAVLNDVYRVGAEVTFPSEVIERVKQKLMRYGYEKWLMDD